MKIFPKLLMVSVAAATLSTAFAQTGAEKVYLDKCANCHSRDGSGQTVRGKRLKLRDLRSAEVQKLTDAQMTDILSKGKGDMPGYQKDLGDAQIKEMVAYMRQMGKK
jgi:mono/diheme cytochrome c family protein